MSNDLSGQDASHDERDPASRHMLTSPALGDGTHSAHRVTAVAASRMDTALRAIISGIAHTSGGEFYRALAQECGRAFAACDVSISELTADGTRTNLLGSWTRPGLPPASERILPESAAELVMQAGVIHHAADARAEHPQDDRLARLYAEGYLGVPIVDGRGDIVGVIELTSDSPGLEMEPAATIISALASRVVAELERSQAEAALRDSELRYRTLIEDSFHLVAEIVDERFVFTSAGYGDALGYAPEDVLGGSLYDLIHPDDRRSVAADLQAMVAQRRSARFTVRMQHQDGSWRWIESTARAFRASTGEYRTTLFSRDITAQQETEQDLREKEARFRTLVNDLQVGVLLHGSNGEILHANDTCLQLLGLTHDEMLGSTPHDVPWELVRDDGSPLPLDEQPEVIVLRTAKPVRDAVVGIKRSGNTSILWLLVSAEPRTGADGERQVVVTFTDISLRLAAEEQLRDSEERFRLLAENASDVILRYAPSGECTWVSPSVETVTGYTPEEFISLRPEQTVMPEDIDRGRKVWARAAEGWSGTIEYRFPHKDGRTIWLELTSKAVRDAESGAVTEIHMSGRDITARKKAVKELRESEERFRLLGENASDIIVTFEPDGLCTWISPSVTTMAGYLPEELIGTYPRFLVHPEDLEETAAKRAEVLSSDGITTSVFRFPHKDGHFLWMESKSRSIRDPQTGEITQVHLAARDITARKQAEDDVRESEERFRLLAENATDIIARFDPEGVCTWISPSIEVVSGYAPREIVGQYPRAFLHPDDVETALAAKRQALATTTSVTAVYRFPRKSGGYLWMESTNKAVRAEDGSVLEIQMSARDITARKQAEDDVRESEVRFRTLIQNLGAGILLLDAEAKILVANEAAPRLLGVNHDQLVGYTPYDPAWRIVREDGSDFPDDERPVLRAIATRQQVQDVVMGVDSPEHDRRIWLSVSAQPLLTADGEVHQVICSFSDITARLAAESELREREEQFRLLAEHSTDLIGRYAFDGTCLWISPSSLAITGYTPEELIGKDASPHFHPDDLPGAVETMAQMAKGAMNTTSSFRFRHKDGHYIWLEAKSRAICDDEGAIIEVQSTTRDVTARIQREEELRESEARFRLLAENATDIIARYDAEGTCLWISPSVTTVTGFLPEEIVGMQLPQLVHRKDTAMLDDASRLMSDGTTAFSTTFRVPHKDGRIIWLEATNRMIRDPQTGRVVEIHTSSRDITARKEAEEALRRSEVLFRATLESTADGILVTKPGGTLLYWNSRAAQMLQVPQEVLDSHDSVAFVQHIVERATDPQGLVMAISSLPLDEPANAGSWDGFDGKRFEIYAHPLDAENGERLRVWSIRDVTAEHAGEIALRESEERFRSLAEHTTDLTLGIVGAGTIDYASPNAEAILGYTAESLIGSNAMDIVHVDDLAQTFDDFATAAETGTAAHSTLRVKHGDGTLRWFELTSNFFRNDRDELRAVVTARDITEQHLAQDALRDSEDRLRAVVNSAPLVLFAVDTDRRFVLAEGEALRTLGLQSSDLIGHSIDEVYANFPNVLTDVTLALSGEEFAAQYHVGDVAFQAHYGPTRDERGNITSMIGVGYDITSRMRAEQALRESEETARALLNAPTDGAVLVDREGTILAMNATAERRFNEHAAKQGLSDLSFIGTCVYDLFPPDLRDQRRARNDDVFTTGERSHYEDERDGTWTDVTIDPIHDAEGNVVRLAIFSRDITDRKRDEAALKKRSRELEALNDYLEKTHTELERSQEELRDASEQLAELLDAEQARAKTDPLTGVLNHGAISEVITEAIAAEINFAVAMVDVDGMKAVNDTFGHQAGDDVLLAVTKAVRRGGAIVGRYGGDEFLVALLNADGNEASAYKAAVDAALLDAHVVDPESGARVPVVASVGIASYPADAPTLPELIERADEQMYAEKRARQGVGTGLSSSRILGSERAARMVGELVPLLTSEESLADKLRLVAHRVTVGGGYAGVNFDVFVQEDDGGQASTASQNAFTKAPDELIEEWNRQQRSGANDTGVGELLRETKRPLIIESIAESDYVTDDQKKLLLSVGILSAIVVPLFADDTMVATMSVGSKEPAAFGHNDEQFLTAVAGQVAAIIRMARLVDHLQHASDRLEASRDETVMLLAAAAEAHSQTASLHYENVRVVSEAIATEMGIDAAHVRELGIAAALHDIGKIRVPDSLLSSPERFSPTTGAAHGHEDWELLKEHCIHGRDFLERTTGFELAARIAYSHHERWDGGGYPEGIAGEAIPLESAIIAVADSLDAIMSERAYQPGRPLDIAMAEIITNRGTQFRPDVVDALVAIYERGELAGIWDGGAPKAAAAA